MGTVVVGLTGGIGTGKSRVADLLRELGAAVECADRIVREVQAPGGAALEEIVDCFGPEVLLPSGELDRARLGERVFRDPEARRKLNTIVHPHVGRILLGRLDAHRRRGAPVVILDIPLLLEGRASGRGSAARLPFDLVALVYADEKTQIERVVARDGLSPEAVRARVRSQMPIEEKRRLADVVIDNSGDWERTARQVRTLFESWVRNGGRTGPPG